MAEYWVATSWRRKVCGDCVWNAFPPDVDMLMPCLSLSGLCSNIHLLNEVSPDHFIENYISPSSTKNFQLLSRILFYFCFILYMIFWCNIKAFTCVLFSLPTFIFPHYNIEYRRKRSFKNSYSSLNMVEVPMCVFWEEKIKTYFTIVFLYDELQKNSSKTQSTHPSSIEFKVRYVLI
jgi:hypothetical protein